MVTRPSSKPMIDQLETFLRDPEFGVRPGRLPGLVRGALDQAPAELPWVEPLRERADGLTRSLASTTSLRRLPIIADVTSARLRAWSPDDFQVDPATANPFLLSHFQVVLLLLLSADNPPWDWLDDLPRVLTSVTPQALAQVARPLASAPRSVASALARVRDPLAAPPVRTAAHAQAVEEVRSHALGFARLVVEEAVAHPDGPAAASSALADLVFLFELPGAVLPRPDALLARGHLYLADLAHRLGDRGRVGRHHQDALHYFESPTQPSADPESRELEALLSLTAARSHLGTPNLHLARPFCRDACELIQPSRPEALAEILLLETETFGSVDDASAIEELAERALELLDGRREDPADLLRLRAFQYSMHAAWGRVLATLDRALFRQPTDQPLDQVLSRALEEHRQTLGRIGELADRTAPLLLRHQPTLEAFTHTLAHLGRSFLLAQPLRSTQYLQRAAEHYLAADQPNALLTTLLDLSYPLLLDGIPLDAIPEHTLVAQLLGYDHPVRTLYARNLPMALVEGHHDAIRTHLRRRSGPFDARNLLDRPN